MRRILAFPVRSLRGVFAWVTCPAVLQRLGRDLQLAGLSPIGETSAAWRQTRWHVPPTVRCWWTATKSCWRSSSSPAWPMPARWRDWVAGHAVDDPATQARIKNHLAVLCDDDFTHFVRHATEVVARVGLDYERKTVKQGALFYQEFLPAETLFYAVVFASASRREGDARPAAEILAYLQQKS